MSRRRLECHIYESPRCRNRSRDLAIRIVWMIGEKSQSWMCVVDINNGRLNDIRLHSLSPPSAIAIRKSINCKTNFSIQTFGKSSSKCISLKTQSTIQSAIIGHDPHLTSSAPFIRQLRALEWFRNEVSAEWEETSEMEETIKLKKSNCNVWFARVHHQKACATEMRNFERVRLRTRTSTQIAHSFQPVEE